MTEIFNKFPPNHQKVILPTHEESKRNKNHVEIDLDIIDCLESKSYGCTEIATTYLAFFGLIAFFVIYFYAVFEVIPNFITVFNS